MLSSLFFTTVWVTLLLPCVVTTKAKHSLGTSDVANWAEMTASRLVTCEYQNASGLWKNEQMWQSGSTMETLANFVMLMDSPLKYIFHQTFINTDMFTGGNCYDDYQWWLLGWLQAYMIDRDIRYLYRAADIHDYVAANAWNDNTCNGGVQWCSNNAYKNAITNELFLLTSIRLHPYATILGRPSTFYLDWALKEWQWFEASGLINSDSLINEGLRYEFSTSRIRATFCISYEKIRSCLMSLFSLSQFIWSHERQTAQRKTGPFYRRHMC